MNLKKIFKAQAKSLQDYEELIYSKSNNSQGMIENLEKNLKETNKNLKEKNLMIEMKEIEVKTIYKIKKIIISKDGRIKEKTIRFSQRKRRLPRESSTLFE